MIKVEESWLDQAACAKTNPDLFFPPRGVGRRSKHAQAAKEICAGCPVRRDCLQWALDNDEVGIWGGLTQRERVVFRHGGNLRLSYRQKAS
jgi:WhiB family redox-sensing transcriptional regulator